MFLQQFICVAVLCLLALFGSDAVNVQPNVIIMTVNNLHWNDLGIHVNRKDSENSTPNIDYLAYSGIILNRFYANGGYDALVSGCYQRSKYANINLMSRYFEQNGYKVDFMMRQNDDKIEAFHDRVLGAIVNDKPYFMMVNFGPVGDNIKMPFIDEIVGSIVSEAHKMGTLENTIILFLSLPDNETQSSSTVEVNIRRNAFLYSPLIKHQQHISTQLFHVIDILPTLVNATHLKWRTRDRIYIDGINQWQSLDTNNQRRFNVFGDNFYINGLWKLSYGLLSDTPYDSIDNEDMESDKDTSGYDFQTYIKSIFASDVHGHLPQHSQDSLSTEKIKSLRMRAKVHCNLADVDEMAVKNMKCTHMTPCLFDLSEDPCEFDNKHEPEFDAKRDSMRKILDRYLSGELNVNDVSIIKTVVEDPIVGSEPVDVSWKTGAILGGTVFGVFLILIVIVCIKERCNRRRSVYHDRTKTKKIRFEDQSDAKVKNGKITEIGTANGKIEVAVISQGIN